jgi:protein-S-isoprenylcysteine O-methyltransferase Ste14
VRPSLRTLRLKLTWLLVLPFLWLARPTPGLLLVGLFLALPGLALRALAAGHIEKDRALATTGPYAALRHPLYLGSFFVGSGLVVAGGRWLLLPLFLGLMALVYGKTIDAEEAELARLFGDDYRAYKTRVPAFVPRLGRGAARGFSAGLFLRNREWEALLGVLGGFLILSLKMLWISP